MSNLPKRMATDWDRRASEDALYYVLNLHQKGEMTVEEFLSYGVQEMADSVDPFLADNQIDPSVRVCLEIGCGAGRLTSGLAKRFSSVIATDVSKKMLEVAHQITADQGLDNITFKKLTGFNLDGIADGSVDFVYSCIVFQHIPDPELQYSYLADIFRVLSPTGIFLVEFYNNQPAYDRISREWKLRQEIGSAADWGPYAEHELSSYDTSIQTPVSAGRVREIIHKNGYTITCDRGEGTDIWWIGGIPGAT